MKKFWCNGLILDFQNFLVLIFFGVLISKLNKTNCLYIEG